MSESTIHIRCTKCGTSYRAGERHGCFDRTIDPYTAEPAGIDSTLAQRGSTYGDFTDNAAISEALMGIIHAAPGWSRFDPVKRAGVWIMMQKLSRALAGDPEYKDNWHDIAGYAKLIEDRCKS